MATLAQKLPYTHAFSGGAQWGGHQRLPSDPDALDYLSRLAAVEGAVEVGIAMAVENFIKGCKADGIWDAIKASCLLCGARTLAGALVPLKNEGPELWDDPNPSFIVNSDGSAGTWDAATNTMSNAAVSTSIFRPRFDWGTALPAGNTVRITGRFSGDMSHIYRIAAGTATVAYQSDINPDGSFAATVVPTSSALYIYIDGTLGPASVTIESLSIREVIAAPTNVNNNFVEADYNRGTGLKGNGSTKYLDSGRANNADPQNDKHMACYHSAAGSPPEALIGSIIRTPALSVSQVFLSQIPSVGANINSPANKEENGSAGTGIVGAVRNAGTQTLYFAGNSYDEERESNGHHLLNTFVFARNDEGAVSFPSDATLAFYSIGEALDLALLDTRVTALVQRIQLSLSTGLDASGYDDATVAYLLAAYNNGATLA